MSGQRRVRDDGLGEHPYPLAAAHLNVSEQARVVRDAQRRLVPGAEQSGPLIHQLQVEAVAAHRFHAQRDQALADQPRAHMLIDGRLSQPLGGEPRHGIEDARFLLSHGTFYPTRPYCSACPTQRLTSGATCSGQSRSKLSAATCTRGKRSASRNKSATRICARPVWRVPSNSPGPRNSRSRRATSNPSFVPRITASRSRASDESGWRYSSRQELACWPRPTR